MGSAGVICKLHFLLQCTLFQLPNLPLHPLHEERQHANSFVNLKGKTFWWSFSGSYMTQDNWPRTGHWRETHYAEINGWQVQCKAGSSWQQNQIRKVETQSRYSLTFNIFAIRMTAFATFFLLLRYKAESALSSSFIAKKEELLLGGRLPGISSPAIPPSPKFSTLERAPIWWIQTGDAKQKYPLQSERKKHLHCLRMLLLHNLPWSAFCENPSCCDLQFLPDGIVHALNLHSSTVVQGASSSTPSRRRRWRWRDLCWF